MIGRKRRWAERLRTSWLDPVSAVDGVVVVASVEPQVEQVIERALPQVRRRVLVTGVVLVALFVREHSVPGAHVVVHDSQVDVASVEKPHPHGRVQLWNFFLNLIYWLIGFFIFPRVWLMFVPCSRLGRGSCTC